MNQRPPGLKLSKCIEGFILYKSAEGLRPRTLHSYQRHLERWAEIIKDPLLENITPKDVRHYLDYMRNDYVPQRMGGNEKPLSPKSIRNIWVTLSSFFTWATVEFQIPNPMDQVPAPRYKLPPVEPFKKEEIEAILKAARYNRETDPWNRRKFVTQRSTAARDEAMILTLLDSGLRAGELCSLTLGDVDMKTGKVAVRHGDEGGAKGGKGRFVYLGKAARRSLWRYLANRSDDEEPSTTPLFLTRQNRPMNRNALRQVVNSIGERAGVQPCYPHLFRHTFAITYLRSGGDIFTLQRLLGHSSLDMVKHYAMIADIDVERAHRKASPVDNWHL